MRIRTILAAAAAPAALAAVLLGTASQASAAVATPTQAVLTASVQKAATYKANTHQHDVADTTFGYVQGATKPSDGGPIWAYDNLERSITATDNGLDTTGQYVTGTHIYDVTISSQGSYSAFASPIDGHAWNGNGPVSGWVKFTVYSTTPPSDSNLPAQLDSSLHSSGIVQQWFGPNGHLTGGDQYHFEYKGIDGVDGVYVQP